MNVHLKALTICSIVFSILTGSYVCTAQCTLGSEMVVNGGFECTASCTGSTRLATIQFTPFTTAFNFRTNCTGNSLGGGNYIVTSSPDECCPCFIAGGDAEGPSTHGGSYAAVFDAPGNTNINMWCQSVDVTAGTVYAFTAWYKNAKYNSGDAIPSIQMTVNGTAIGGTAEVVSDVNFKEAGCFYQAPSNTTVEICLQMLSDGAAGGNDVIVDDISFKPVTGGSGCAVGTCTYNGVVLPVELGLFNAKKIATNKSVIKWLTSSEENASYFSVEKSDDGVLFYEIGKVPASGWSSDLLTYEHYDTYFSQSSYYRLKIVDNDGSYKFSNVIFLSNEEQHVWVINNNSEELEIKAIVNEDINWNIEIYSLLGRVYVNEEVNLVKGENSLLKKKINQGDKEPAICRITDSNGEVILLEMVLW